MEETCERALELGLSAVAFTEHADFTERVKRQGGRLDTAGYWKGLERCRRRYPSLRVLSGVELGEAHRFPDEATEILASGPFDLVLGSVHCAPVDGELTDATALPMLGAGAAVEFLRSYFEETLRLLAAPVRFDVLTHIDYPKRYWPLAEVPYDERAYEPQLRSILDAAVRRRIVLEVNTTRGMDPARGLCPGRVVLNWWCEAGGTAVSLGSDAHDPSMLAEGFDHAQCMLADAGFEPPLEGQRFWTHTSAAGGTW